MSLYDHEEFKKHHIAQLKTQQIPEHLWEALGQKLTFETFDAGSQFQLARDEESCWHVLVTENDLKKDDPNSIFLVDHAWTYEAEFAEAQLKQYPTLLERMLSLMDLEVDFENGETEESLLDRRVNAVLENMWRFNNTYDIKMVAEVDGKVVIQDEKSLDNKETLWYVMDEFGSRFDHSDEPNMMFRVFCYAPTGVQYTVIYPLEDIAVGEEATRNYILTKNHQDARLYPWYPDRLDVDEVSDDWLGKLKEEKEFRGSEDYPDGPGEECPSKQKYKVFSDCFTVREYLTHERFELVEERSEADILWLVGHFRDFKTLAQTPHKRVTQFPNAMIITCKDLFSETARRSIPLRYPDGVVPEHIKENRGPEWLQTTFDLHQELPQFIKCYKERERKGMNNYWILKPWNYARGIGMTITNNLDRIIKLGDNHPPKIACEYIHNPVLFHREDTGGWVKHEHRFQVFLKSIKPLEVLVHKIFYLRFANKPFQLANFDDYQTHFCIMAYKGFDLLQIPDVDYIPMFDKQYPHIKWADVHADTFKAIKEFFVAATAEGPPNGLFNSKQCRGNYGFDLIYKWKDETKTSIQPVILEVNFSPQISRGSKMYPPYVNEVFQSLFTDDVHENMIML